jgi:hypothetical protein
LIAGSNLSASTTASSSYAVRGICTNGSFTGNVGILATNKAIATDFNFLQTFGSWNGTTGTSQFSVRGDGLVLANNVQNSVNNQDLRITGNGGGISTTLCIGTGAVFPLNDNAWTCGSSTNKWSAVWATNGTIQTSAEVLKDHTPLTSGLEELQQLNTVEFEWKREAGDEIEEEDDKGHRRKRKRKHLGLLAENVKTVFPDIVHGEGENLGVNYAELVPLLVNCIKQLNEKVTALEGQGFTAAAAPPAKRRKRSVPMEEISANFWTAGGAAAEHS